MFARSWGWSVAVLALALITAAPAQQKADKPTEKKPREIKGWGTPVDPDGDCKFGAKDKMLMIVIPGKHHDLTHTAQYTKLNSPRVLQTVDGDFSLAATVKKFVLPKADTSSGGNFSFTSAGLLLWQDDKNFVRFDRASEGNAPSPFLWIEHFSGGKPVTQELAQTANENVRLRIERKGDELTFSAKEDGKDDWRKVYSAKMKLAPELKVGVLAINSTNRVVTAEYEDLELNSGK
jgi:regulation of enolase protein 1 (concanavalin A-like superfamily)